MISLVVPTYNEKDNIRPLVEKIHQSMSRVDNAEYEIVFVDDNSPDGTAEVVESLSPDYNVRLLLRKDKKGLASAVIDGFSVARGEVLGVIDADLQHPPDIIPKLLSAINDGADIAIASRYVKGGAVPTWGFLRRLISKGAIMLSRLLLPTTRNVKDPMAGFFFFRKELIDGKPLKPIGYKILLEILAMTNPKKVTEVPYVFSDRSSGRSKLGLNTQIGYLKHLFSIMLRNGEALKLGKFCLVGLSGTGVNTGMLWALVNFAGLQNLIALAISIETSIISNFLLNDYFTFHEKKLSAPRLLFRRFLQFNAVSLPGAAINLSVAHVLNSSFGVHYLLSNVIGIAIATLWNYFLNSWWTWRLQSELNE